MIDGILGKKLGMTQVFASDGSRIPVTVVEAGPCVVLQKKSEAKDGYNALQLGFGPKKTHRTNNPMMGHFKAAGKGAFYRLREVAAENIEEVNVGDEVRCDIFNDGDFVDVAGSSKGKGFQGVVKRWGFSGGRSSHGSQFHRRAGAIGASADPARVFKGKKMSGQMGSERVTVQNLQIVEVRPEQNLILVRGAVPGAKNDVVLIRRAIKK